MEKEPEKISFKMLENYNYLNSGIGFEIEATKLFGDKIRNLEELLKQLNSTEKLETKIEQSPKTKPWKQLFNKKN